MSFWRAPSLDELAIIAAAIIAFIVWKTAIDDSGGDAVPAPTPVVATPAPATATAAATATPTPVATAAPSPTATPTPAPAVSTDQCDFGDVAANVRAAIVEVAADFGTERSRGGTAFHIGGGVYVTAAHVIQNDDGRTAGTITLWAGDRPLSATVIKRGSFSEDRLERDIATLRAEGINAVLKTRSPSRNDEVASIDVRAFGYPWSGIRDDSSPGGTLQTSRGVFSARTTRDGIEIVQTDAGVDRGMSGGPLVDECGYALAVASFSETRVTDGEAEDSEFPVFISIAELDNLE